MNTDEQTITIRLSEYNELKHNSDQLALLEANGVDNWQGYCTLPDRYDYDSDEEYRAAIEKLLFSN